MAGEEVVVGEAGGEAARKRRAKRGLDVTGSVEKLGR